MTLAGMPSPAETQQRGNSQDEIIGVVYHRKYKDRRLSTVAHHYRCGSFPSSFFEPLMKSLTTKRYCSVCVETDAESNVDAITAPAYTFNRSTHNLLASTRGWGLIQAPVLQQCLLTCLLRHNHSAPALSLEPRIAVGVQCPMGSWPQGTHPHRQQ